MIQFPISIVIPIYKVEEYLRECVDSVLKQNYQNIEVILIDDGSPDGCPKICDEYAALDKRVKVIHKANGGLSDARNVGIENSTGDYIVFLDSDDYWSDVDALKKMNLFLNQYPKTDILYFRRFSFRDRTGEILSTFPKFNEESVNGKDIIPSLKYLIRNDSFIPSACNKIVRRDILKDVYFTKGIVSEDIDWNFALTLKAENLLVSNECFYAYRRRTESITKTLETKNVDDLISIIEKWNRQLSSEENDKSQILLEYLTYQMSIALGLIYYIEDSSRRKEFIGRIKRLKHLWKIGQSKKVKKVATLLSVFGTKFTGRILAYYIKRK